MERTNIQLKTKKNKKGLDSLFADKKRRYLFMFLFMLPFIIGIIVFSVITVKQVNSIINLAQGDTKAETKAENIIESMDYILRDNPTDLQKEYFAQLKSAIEEGVIGEETANDAMIAQLVAKNYIADFYTWTNKRGQYDIGGFYYIYDGEFENGDHFKENAFQKARDGFYKYISSYAAQYGKENLLEVADVTIVSCEKTNTQYVINEHIENRQDANGEWYDYRENRSYDCYVVKCKWTYKDTTKLNLSQFATSINLAVIKKDNRFEIVEASENTINARKGSEANSSTETSEVTGSSSASD
ncbi:MAG: hypothetical protein IK151_08815 [Erysipelotrichaceae bacterium]|nr:hypothetical protein [Erysipelotrichaceae bacterium]